MSSPVPPEPFAPLKQSVEFERSFDALIGTRYTSVSELHAAAELEITDLVRGADGFVHGGIHAAIAEGLASIATAVSVAPHGLMCSGMSNHTSVIEQVGQGTLHATARRTSAAADTWIWHVEIRDEQERVCALSTMTIAVRPSRA